MYGNIFQIAISWHNKQTFGIQAVHKLGTNCPFLSPLKILTLTPACRGCSKATVFFCCLFASDHIYCGVRGGDLGVRVQQLWLAG